MTPFRIWLSGYILSLLILIVDRVVSGEKIALAKLVIVPIASWFYVCLCALIWLSEIEI
jgi:Na+/alanine symporter